MRRLVLIFPLILLSFLTSCEIINPSEELPAYIKVNDPRVNVDSLAGFTHNYGLKDVWLYQNGDLAGIHPVPETVIPYINLDRSEFRFQGGIFESGLSNFRLPYPYWELIQLQINQPALDTFEITPVFNYQGDDRIEFALSENFENGFQLSPYGPILDTARMHVSTREAFQGNSSGRVRFDADHTYWEVVSNLQINSLEAAQDPWLEVTYKTDFVFDIGMRYWPASSPIDENIRAAITILPKGTEEWSTVYVHLVDLVRAAPSDSRYTLWFRSSGGGEEGELFLDNLRLVHLD